MEFVETLRRRHMVRRYDPSRPVAREDLDDIVRAGLRAPSAGFAQGTRFLVLDEPTSVGSFWAATANTAPADAWLIGMQTAPAIIVVYADRDAYEIRYRASDKAGESVPTDLEQRWPVPYWLIDAAMSAMLIQLAAVDRGLAHCFFAVPTDRVTALAAAFGVPIGLAPIGAITVGFADPATLPRNLRSRRKPAADVVSYRRFDQSRESAHGVEG